MELSSETGNGRRKYISSDVLQSRSLRQQIQVSGHTCRKNDFSDKSVKVIGKEGKWTR